MKNTFGNCSRALIVRYGRLTCFTFDFRSVYFVAVDYGSPLCVHSARGIDKKYLHGVLLSCARTKRNQFPRYLHNDAPILTYVQCTPTFYDRTTMTGNNTYLLTTTLSYLSVKRSLQSDINPILRISGMYSIRRKRHSRRKNIFRENIRSVF